MEIFRPLDPRTPVRFHLFSQKKALNPAADTATQSMCAINPATLFPASFGSAPSCLDTVEYQYFSSYTKAILTNI